MVTGHRAPNSAAAALRISRLRSGMPGDRASAKTGWQSIEIVDEFTGFRGISDPV
jgi:hypothetical protein